VTGTARWARPIIEEILEDGFASWQELIQQRIRELEADVSPDDLRFTLRDVGEPK
jgi:hypothetical protein